MNHALPQLVLDQLNGAQSRLKHSRVLVGLDGFVDTILRVVRIRESATQYKPVLMISDFAERVSAASGVSANFEMVPQVVKLGGNGPIMANALGSYDTRVTYIGNLGAPHLHPVFADFAKTSKVISIAEPGYTDAVEFEDGKLMLGKHASLHEVNWKNILRFVPEEKLIEMFERSSLIALVNWTMLPYMTDILQKVLTRVAPSLTGEKRWIFFDLCDPAKRTNADITRMLKLIAKFQKYFRVILGLNLQESRQIGAVLGIDPPPEMIDAVEIHAAAIQRKLKVETVVVHPRSFAAAADAHGACVVAGPVAAKPKITTGAGDHFNAGFCIGRLLGCDLASSLQIGVATSGFYVRQAKSPSLEDLRKFLQALQTGQLSS
ncbi:MAG: hypothetical protein M3O82_07865 [Verrucomicrobiota bacterium]|nr:hypothetical protein [Verrucomicrobiota bacterium]